MGSPKPLLVAKVTTAEQAHAESARCLANANEDRAAGKLDAADQWDRDAQHWLDRRNDLAGDGEGRAPGSPSGTLAGRPAKPERPARITPSITRRRR